MNRARRRLMPLLIGVVCIAGLAWAIRALGPRRVVDVGLRADPWWLTLSLVPLAGRFVVWGFKWKRMLARRQPVPFGQALQIIGAGAFVNLTTPTAKLAGAVVRAVLLQRRRGWGLAECYGWSIADQATNVLGQLLLYAALASGVAAIVPPGPARAAYAASGGAVVALLALVTLARDWLWRGVRRPRVVARIARLVPARLRRGDPSAVARRLRPVFDPLLHHGGRRAFLSDVVLSALSFASLCLANAMVLRSLGVRTPLVVGATVVVVGYFAGVAVGAWGGIGVTEAALTGLYVRFGVPLDQAAAAALLHRAVYYLVVLGWGGGSLLRQGDLAPSSPSDDDPGDAGTGKPEEDAEGAAYSDTSSRTPV